MRERRRQARRFPFLTTSARSSRAACGRCRLRRARCCSPPPRWRIPQSAGCAAQCARRRSRCSRCLPAPRKRGSSSSTESLSVLAIRCSRQRSTRPRRATSDVRRTGGWPLWPRTPRSVHDTWRCAPRSPTARWRPLLRRPRARSAGAAPRGLRSSSPSSRSGSRRRMRSQSTTARALELAYYLVEAGDAERAREVLLVVAERPRPAAAASAS